MRSKESYLDLAKFRARLGEGKGRTYWRSLEELCEDPEFEQVIRSEFPEQAISTGFDRRNFLRLMGASVAFGGLAACARPFRQIVPYVRKPEDTIPGKPLFYASAFTFGGAAAGVLVESHEGRPTKIEGNPDHPSSLGATDAFIQASILSLYDPDRSPTVRYLGNIGTWTDLLGALQPVLQQAKTTGGAGIRVLTESINSPTLGAQLTTFFTRYPQARWHQYEAASLDNAREGSRLAFGSYVNTVYRFDLADVVVSLDSDFLSSGPGHLRYARDFGDRRRVRANKKTMNRLYAVATTPSPTSSIADHRLPLKPSDVVELSRALAAAVGLGGAATSPHAKWIAALAKDLRAHAGRSIVVAGDQQPAEVHAIAHAINATLGNEGKTVLHTDPIEAMPMNHIASMRQLVADINAGAVQTLIMFGGNPMFTAPADLNFAEAIQKVGLRVHLSPCYDETSVVSHWHIPQTHFLEEWSDARGHDGTVSIVQPLIAPLYNGRSAHELAGALIEDHGEPYQMVRNVWQAKAGALNFEKTWQKWLNDGVIASSALPARAMSAALPAATPIAKGGEYEIVFRPDPMIWDGRFANNGWLQELPKPITKITWDNAAQVSPATAAKLGIKGQRDGSKTDTLKISYRGRSVTLPVWVNPGHADETITVYFGYGRTRSGKVGDGTGFNLYPLRTSDAPDFAGGVSLAKTGELYPIASTQIHQALEGKDYDRADLVHSLTIEEFAKNPHEIAEKIEVHEQNVTGGPSMYPAWKYDGNKWAMLIDTNVCTGCNGCVVACQAENNIPIVGKEQVLIHREMHWLRIDHYYKGTAENPQTFHQPIPCMHCENAPCEPVCPVEATSHSSEGLNEMTYNRCVGTRYCANNCPYKVRRFNFLPYQDFTTESLKSMRNPDVTVRSRGVMEKCTYCVQRINAARIDAERESRTIRDGEVTTACAAACPSRAITFGNLNDPESEVAALRREPLHYALLAELNTQPRTTYLAALRNPNPELEAE